MDTTPLPLVVVPPSQVGIDASGLVDFVHAEDAAGQELHSLLVLIDGEVGAEAYWVPYGPDDAAAVYSLSKTFTSAGVGIAQDRGLLNWDDRIVDLIPELADAPIGPRARAITLRDCLGMATGHTQEQVDAVMAGFIRNPYLSVTPAEIAALLAVEPEGKTGVTFAYNNFATYACSVAAGRVLGRSVWDELRTSVFAPLGIRSDWWGADGLGNSVGCSELRIAPRDIARFFRMLMDDGTHQGSRLLGREWLGEYSRRHTATQDPSVDSSQGYGWQVWMSTHGHRADGAFGQFALMLPEQRTLVVITGCQTEAQTTLDNVWAHILPALTQGGTPEADARWHKTASRLRLPGRNLSASGPSGDVDAGCDGWHLAAHPQPDGHTLTLTDPRGVVHALDATLDSWTENRLTWDEWSLTVRARAGWDGGLFHADLVIPQTPHRLQLTTRGDVLEVGWNCEPIVACDLADLAVSPCHAQVGKPR